MKILISTIHLGRYRIDLLDDDDQISTSTDGGSALIMKLLTEFIFGPEHAQYERDQWASSEDLFKILHEETS